MDKKPLIFLLFVTAAGGALAILPPDASEREPEIRAQRIRVKKEYEERMEKRRELATRQYEQATADIAVPPWELKRRMSGEPDKKIEVQIQQEQAAEKETRKQVLVSIMLFIIIGSIVGWVRHKTRDVEL